MALIPRSALAILIGIAAVGCGNSDPASTPSDNSIPPPPQSKGNTTTYDNDPSKGGVGADGMPGGGPNGSK